MPSLSYSRTGSTAQIYGNKWGSESGVWTLDHLMYRLEVGLEPRTLDHSSPTRYHCAMLAHNNHVRHTIVRGMSTVQDKTLSDHNPKILTINTKLRNYRYGNKPRRRPQIYWENSNMKTLQVLPSYVVVVAFHARWRYL